MKKIGEKRILVIEDENHIAEGLKLNLALQGYDVMIAPNGVSGLDQWKKWQPDLIVLDIMLPGINGFSVLQSIRLEDEQIPILILSAKSVLYMIRLKAFHTAWTIILRSRSTLRSFCCG